MIAIELARRLEAKGLTGQLILIDGAPFQLKAIQAYQIRGTIEAELQNTALTEIMHMVSPTDISQVIIIISYYHY